MHYILVTELESHSDTTCKVMNLPSAELNHLIEYFTNHKIVAYCITNDIFEVELPGAKLLTKLSDSHHNYKVVGQSMAIEHTVIGGGTVKVQKIVWTLVKE